ncbi:MAG: hypothetical protein UV73_C0001G0099 [Candidatus Gottesmanbacteria bacterium GW2011_GWA2_43_14]|uniref:Cell division protein FtsL n=1 Tax=Candidatus Gottesmanbacteria bacterium GW2011_GWA2_43_14 TaxID=1618443 RepID=A0A0G1GIG3_9BACT|nr:MAG: hypothetical protein UV73_C0001G0099 [Candidatus Gottesmanbacteria bacterium GW2011_GWA2_43_14]
MTNKTEKFIKIASLTVAVLSIAVHVVLFNYDSTYGRKYREINSEIERMETENLILSQKIASSSSIASIAQKAETLGFNSSPQVVSLAKPQPIADIGKTL